MLIDKMDTPYRADIEKENNPDDYSFNIIMPVKDSIEKAHEAISAILKTGISPEILTIYDDNSLPENALQLQTWSGKEGWTYCPVNSFTKTPSPNYLYVLQHARHKVIGANKDLIIVESDVVVREDTFAKMTLAKQTYSKKTGILAAVTVNEQNEINYPYEFAKQIKESHIKTKKHLSFCCTLLTNRFLNDCDFDSFSTDKHWYDVTISKRSLELGFDNILLLDTPVTHYPHSSRPWKKLKYTNPLLYYWRKLWYGNDKI